MTNRFTTSVAAIALIAGTSFAYAQGTGASHEGSSGSAAQQSAPASGHVLELFQYLAPPGSSPDRIEVRDVGTAHLCFLVDDLIDVHRRLVGAGVDTFISPPVLVDTGINAGGYGIYLRDPDGIVLELFQPPRRDTGGADA